MGSLSIWHWLILIIYVGFGLVGAVKILGRAGHSAWWSVLVLIPVVNMVALWIFSRAPWPTRERAAKRP